MVELFIANQQLKRDVIENPKIVADIKVSDEIMIDTVAKAEEDPDEVDDEPNSDYISESDIIDSMSWKAPDNRLSSLDSE